MSLQHEIGKRQPFDLPEQEAYLNLQRTASQLAAQSDRLLRPKKLSSPSYNILRILRGAGDEGRLCCEIGRMLITEVPDMTRLIDRLERLQLVQRRRESDDRRNVRVFITPQGLELLAKLDRPIRQLHKQQLGHLSRKDLAELNRLLVAARLGSGQHTSDV